ncbi:hypothetical protein KKE74_00520 [Patescibacteria group bacterium]|nr:hypothetical protein [Patescibacteria group bacterium]MBU2472498.1 hypothetical protein [Patescibacteria group bacterium]
MNNQNPGNPKPSGPQFGLDNEKDWSKVTKGWINKYGSSIILPIIALLILAGGIYLYSNQKGQKAILTLDKDLNQEKTANLNQEEQIDDIKGLIELTENNNQNNETVIQEIIPESRKETGMIIEKANLGEGITHLARKALKNYLQDNPQELTNEHKIYIEDYLKDKTGSNPLEIGEEVSFSEDLIKEAIDASLQLTPNQLKNLEQYSALVAW